MKTELVESGPTTAERTIVIAHGAGAGLDTPFLVRFAEGLGDRGLRVVRFEFPYMAKRREDGKRRGPDRAPVLLECWRGVCAALRDRPNLLIGGKSMGGRMASMVADEVGAAGLVCFGYPFHPPGKPEKTRTEHLVDLKTRTLILQGTRDPFGTPEDVDGYDLSAAIRVQWLEDGDHGFKPRKASGRTEEQNWVEAMDAVATFAEGKKNGI